MLWTDLVEDLHHCFRSTFSIPLSNRLGMQNELKTNNAVLHCHRRLLSVKEFRWDKSDVLRLISDNPKWQHWDNCTVAVHEHFHRHPICLSQLLDHHLMQAREVTGCAIVSMGLLHLDNFTCGCHDLISFNIQRLIPPLELIKLIQNRKVNFFCLHFYY